MPVLGNFWISLVSPLGATSLNIFDIYCSFPPKSPFLKTGAYPRNARWFCNPANGDFWAVLQKSYMHACYYPTYHMRGKAISLTPHTNWCACTNIFDSVAQKAMTPHRPVPVDSCLSLERGIVAHVSAAGIPAISSSAPLVTYIVGFVAATNL